MGRFAVSLGHGRFSAGRLHHDAALEFLRLTPWLGAGGGGADRLLAVVVAYPCSRFSVIGTTSPRHPRRRESSACSSSRARLDRRLARPHGAPRGGQPGGRAVADKRVFYYAGSCCGRSALGLASLDRSMRVGHGGDRRDETAAASVGITSPLQIGITVLSHPHPVGASRTRSTSPT